MQRLQNSKENRDSQPLPTVTTEEPRFGVIVAIFAIGVLIDCEDFGYVSVRPRKSLEMPVIVACTEKTNKQIVYVNFLVRTLGDLD